MYLITFRLIGITPSVASIVVSSADIGAAVGLFELAKAQYKVFQDGACLTPEEFGIGSVGGWLSPEASFD